MAYRREKDSERIILSREDVETMMDVEDGYTHTFWESHFMLCGMDIQAEGVLAAADRGEIEIAGEKAQRLQHGLAWIEVYANGARYERFIKTKEGFDFDAFEKGIA